MSRSTQGIRSGKIGNLTNPPARRQKEKAESLLKETTGGSRRQRLKFWRNEVREEYIEIPVWHGGCHRRGFEVEESPQELVCFWSDHVKTAAPLKWNAEGRPVACKRTVSQAVHGGNVCQKITNCGH